MVVLFILWGCVGDKDSGVLKETGQTNTDQSQIELPLSTMVGHLEALYQIAQDNSNNRAVGTSGGIATRAYIQTTLEDLGYRVWTEPFTLSFYQNNQDPIVSTIDTAYTAATFVYSASGDVTASVQSVDLQIPPAATPNSSTSGCEDSDFVDFVSGSIALIQRGTCTFATKVANAESAGASAVIIFNEGQNNRTDVVEGMLEESGSSVPVVGVSFQTGDTLHNFTGDVRVVVDSTQTTIETENIFAEPFDSLSEQVLLVGAHLDSVVAGPGINDNGSGSAMLLAMADWLASNTPDTQSTIRFAWWSAEELGLLGSQHYVENATDLNEIQYYLNFDMVASPNYVRFIYDGDGSQFGLEGPIGSDIIETAFQTHFQDKGLTFTGTPFDGRSDYGPFIQANIPAGGLFTGAEMQMSEEQALEYNGEAGLEYDACYHKACDTIDNISSVALQEMGDAALNVTLQLATFESANPTPRTQRQVHMDYRGHWLIR